MLWMLEVEFHFRRCFESPKKFSNYILRERRIYQRRERWGYGKLFAFICTPTKRIWYNWINWENLLLNISWEMRR